MPYSETDAQATEAAENFCRSCEHLRWQAVTCSQVGMKEMINRYRKGACAFASVKGVPGTMTLEGFEAEEGGETTA